MNRPVVGMIGVGALGLAVAERLLAAGFAVNGYRRGALDVFTAAGGTPMPDAAAVVQSADPVILLLPSDAALAEVIAQITPGLRQRQVILCLGTHELAAKRAAAAVVADAGAVMLDAEVSGTPAMLRAGRASVMVAGDMKAAEAIGSVLDAFASATARLGAFGNATRMKLVTNYLVGVHTLAAAEALLLAQRLGLDLHAVIETIAPSAGGSTMFSVRGRMMAAGNFSTGDITGFLRFFELLRAALAGGDAVGSPLLDLTEGLYRRAIADGFGDRDIAAIYCSLGGSAPP